MTIRYGSGICRIGLIIIISGSVLGATGRARAIREGGCGSGLRLINGVAVAVGGWVIGVRFLGWNDGLPPICLCSGL